MLILQVCATILIYLLGSAITMDRWYLSGELTRRNLLCRFGERVIQYKCQKEGQMRSEEMEPVTSFVWMERSLDLSLSVIISH